MRWLAPALLSFLFVHCGPSSVTVVLNADNNSGQAGLATITARGAGVRVAVSIAADVTDATPQAAHLHKGRCGELGEVAWALSPVGPSAADAAHFSSTTDLPSAAFTEVTKGAYCLNVHSHADPFLYVSCGNID